MRLVLTLFFCLGPTACLLDFGEVGPQGGSTETGGAPHGGGGGGDPVGGSGGTTPCDGECVPLPDGFSRVIRLTADPCTAVAEGGLDDVAVEAPDALCNCSCQVEEDLCRTVRPSTDTLCTTNAAPILTAPSPECTTLDVPAKAISFPIGGQPTATCSSDGAAATKPPLAFQETTRACPVDESCGRPDEACIPAGEGTYCLLADTASDCPADLSIHRLHAKTDYPDTRDCVCECGGVDGSVGCGVPTVMFFTSNDCSGQGLTGFTSVNCATPTEGSFSSFIFTRSVSGGCNPGAEATTGGVGAPTSGLLLCCRE